MVSAFNWILVKAMVIFKCHTYYFTVTNARSCYPTFQLSSIGPLTSSFFPLVIVLNLRKKVLRKVRGPRTRN